MVERTDLKNHLLDCYHSLLLEYAFGRLDEAQHLIVASHIGLSKKGRSFVQNCEAIGGSLLETECKPAQMRKDSLHNILQKLDETPQKKEACETRLDDFPEMTTMPAILAQKLQANATRRKWRSAYPGFKIMELKLDCKESKAQFMQIDKGAKAPHHNHGGIEITLVLGGAYSDETGHYALGDLIVTDEAIDHAPVACENQGCVCMMVSTSTMKLKGIASLLNPFLRF